MQHKLIIAIFISLFSFTFTANSQKLVNSPYSRFNIGTMEPAGSFRSLGMGGMGISMRDNSSIYFSNPASYSSLDTNSFVFDFGLDYSKNFLTEGATKYSSDDMNFDHLMMGFPLTKGWGVALGVIPLSNGYYKISQAVMKTDPGYDPIVGEYSSYHAGEGGFNKFFFGTGIKLNKNFSAGINMTLLTGQLKRTNQFDFIIDLYPDYNVFNDNSTEKLQLGGINLDYGLQYTAPLKNNYFLNAGVSFSSGKHYNSKYELLTLRYTAFSSRDTVSYVSDNITKAFIPGTLSLGISFGKKDKFTSGIDYVATKWSASKIPGSVGYAADTRTIAFGAELIPDKFSNYSFLKRIEYRIGGHVGDNYLIINGIQIKEYGASLGIGIPMRQTPSGEHLKANLFFDYTRKSGSLSNSLHSEDYITAGISFNLYDFWFVKRKYD